MFKTDFEFKFRLRNLVVEVIETELEYKLLVNKKNMKSSFVREFEKKRKKNQRILKELEFEKYHLARKLKQADQQLEMNFHMKKLALESKLNKGKFQNNDLNFVHLGNKSQNSENTQQTKMKKEKTTIKPAREKKKKMGSKMKIFEEFSEKEKETIEEEMFRMKSFDSSNEELVKMKMAPILKENTQSEEPSNLDSMFEEFANDVPAPKKNSQVDKTLIDFEKTFLDDKIKTPFD